MSTSGTSASTNGTENDPGGIDDAEPGELLLIPTVVIAGLVTLLGQEAGAAQGLGPGAIGDLLEAEQPNLLVTTSATQG